MWFHLYADQTNCGTNWDISLWGLAYLDILVLDAAHHGELLYCTVADKCFAALAIIDSAEDQIGVYLRSSALRAFTHKSSIHSFSRMR